MRKSSFGQINKDSFHCGYFCLPNINPLIDSHAHIYLEHFDDDLDQALQEASEAGVELILMPNIDSSTTDKMLAVANKYAQCIPMMGLHPCSVKENFEAELRHVTMELESGKYLAVGEIGTDLYWDKTFWEEQKAAFNHQCELAVSHNLPIVIHCRETIDETIALVESWAGRGLTGVFHCFTGNLQQARAITELGFFLGIGGVSTFKNGGLDKVLPDVPKELILLETDSPYLAPEPNRGKRNEPAYLKLVANRLAELWGIRMEDVDQITTQNTKRLFGLS